jgi:hypothetical protein
MVLVSGMKPKDETHHAANREDARDIGSTTDGDGGTIGCCGGSTEIPDLRNQCCRSLGEERHSTGLSQKDSGAYHYTREASQGLFVRVGNV